MKKTICFNLFLLSIIFSNYCIASDSKLDGGIDAEPGVTLDNDIKMPVFSIPEEPEFPEFPAFKTLKFNLEIVGKDIKKRGKSGVGSLKGVPPLPKAWVFSKVFKMSEESSFLKAYDQIKSLGAPVFMINCKKDKDPLELQIGPYFDTDPSKVMHGYIVKTQSANLISFLKKMSVHNYNPKKCNFLNY